MGFRAGYNVTSGHRNVLLGHQTGYTSTTGERNVFLGYNAGYYETGNEKLYIETTNTSTPLIYGDFDMDSVQINGSFRVVESKTGDKEFIAIFENSSNDPSYRCDGIQIKAGHDTYSGNNKLIDFATPNGSSIGDIRQIISGVSYETTSDIRLKTNIQPTQYGLQDILNIQVRDYHYKSDLTKTTQTGFLAQQLHTIYPMAVHVGSEDIKSDPWMVDYSKLTPLLVKGIQDQQPEIDRLKKENQDKQAEIQALQAKVNELEQKVAKINQLEAMLLEMKAEQQAKQSDK
jgi:hypothetical protein